MSIEGSVTYELTYTDAKDGASVRELNMDWKECFTRFNQVINIGKAVPATAKIIMTTITREVVKYDGGVIEEPK